ncbi:MAG TPA: hypothetical protein VL137_06425, partial [Polyangiaceae bacterium]|nr:hypothetical protein [Polyangiaceae bacterium]
PSTSVGGTPSTSVGDAGDQDAAMASGGTANGGPGGTQPLGALCVNNSQCSQSQGASVCCVAAGCSAPCECTLQSDCPANTAYLQCATTADCAQYGGGKICCEVMTSQDTMRFCTKQSACTGTILR